MLPDEPAVAKFLLGLFADIAEQCERTPMIVEDAALIPSSAFDAAARYGQAGHPQQPLAWRFAHGRRSVIVWTRRTTIWPEANRRYGAGGFVATVEVSEVKITEVNAKLTAGSSIVTVLQLWKPMSWQPKMARASLIDFLNGKKSF